MFQQYLSQICLSLIFVAFEKIVPIYGNLKYAFLLVLIVFSLLLVVLNFEKHFYLVIYNINRVHVFFCKMSCLHFLQEYLEKVKTFWFIFEW